MGGEDVFYAVFDADGDCVYPVLAGSALTAVEKTHFKFSGPDENITLWWAEMRSVGWTVEHCKIVKASA